MCVIPTPIPVLHISPSSSGLSTLTSCRSSGLHKKMRRALLHQAKGPFYISQRPTRCLWVHSKQEVLPRHLEGYCCHAQVVSCCHSLDFRRRLHLKSRRYIPTSVQSLGLITCDGPFHHKSVQSPFHTELFPSPNWRLRAQS